ncbi:ABC transporter substrate-binding protein [Streptomyces sp. NPDC051018]|uniref:ABC transporter substrate-binding protein n=1 Tax=Streptomyces sp. NPDC051018 TaxID=3365639 RepID=UPI00378CE6F2
MTASTQRRTGKRRVRRALLTLLLTVLPVTTGCAATVQPNDTSVTVAVQPLLDYMPWEFAVQHGLDQQLGLSLRLTYLSQVNSAYQAMQRGDVDVVSTCTACNMPYAVSVPTLRDVLTVNQFKGFIMVGRKGAPSFDALTKQGMPEDRARAAIHAYLKGKTLIGNKVIFGTLVSGLERYAGLRPGDIRVIDVSDDAKAATAFLAGEGDLYMGSLAQESKLLMSYPDRFVNIGGAEVLGPGGLWYGTAAVDQRWLAKNESTVKKLVAIWMRTARYVNERPDLALPVIQKAMNERSGGTFTIPQLRQQIREFVQFTDPGAAARDTYNPGSSLYWKRSLDFYEKQSKSDGTLPEHVDLAKYNIQQQTYESVVRDPALMRWVNAPLT